MTISSLSAKIAMDAAGEGIIIVDLNQKTNPIIYVNEEFLRLTGYDYGELLGKNCNFLQGAKTSSNKIEAIRTTVIDRASCSAELINYKKDVTLFWNQLTLDGEKVHSCSSR